MEKVQSLIHTRVPTATRLTGLLEQVGGLFMSCISAILLIGRQRDQNILFGAESKVM